MEISQMAEDGSFDYSTKKQVQTYNLLIRIIS